MKRYIFCYKNYPLGQLQYDEIKGIGNFTYVYSSDTSSIVDKKPETVIRILEEIHDDAIDIKTIGEFEKYVKLEYGDFHFIQMKGYE